MKINTRIKVFFLLFTINTSLFSQQLFNQSIDSVEFAEKINNFPTGNNRKRYKYIKSLKDSVEYSNYLVKTEAIDWIGIYRNLVFEKKGESDSVIYIVAHYDKISSNIFSTANMFVNGSFDILLSHLYLSDGIYDNGTGVISLISLMEWLNNRQTHYTYRFLFTGMEEYGLRGSRAHVSRLSKSEWQKVVCAINVDMIGSQNSKKITITKNVSDPALVASAHATADSGKIGIQDANIPPGALADFFFFQGQNFYKDFGISLMANLPGAFIPQRSYFTGRKKAVPVINFSDDFKIGPAEMLSGLSPVALGQIHSNKDSKNLVGVTNMVQYQYFFREYVLTIDSH